VPRLVCLLLVLCAALAACGKSDDERYREDLPPINRDLSALAADVGRGLRDAGESGDRALAGEFAGYARRLGGLRGRLDDLEPPGSLEADHDRTLAAMAAERAALSGLAAAARSGDPAGARAAATGVVRQGARLDAARNELARAAR
jgi:hypothetical protein